MNYSHDVAQIAGLTAISFGQEDVDRYIIVYKKERMPSEDEIFARRNGEEWNAETAQKYAQMVICLFRIIFQLLQAPNSGSLIQVYGLNGYTFIVNFILSISSDSKKNKRLN